jgi:hypothetical protein
LVRADRAGQDFELQSDSVESLVVLLHDQTADLDRPITVRLNGERCFEGTVARTISGLAQSLAERGDPHAMFPARITVQKPGAGK